MIQTIRYNSRKYFSHPTYSVFMILILVIGIGGSSSIFSIIEATLIRPLPFKDPDRIVYIEGDIGTLYSRPPKYIANDEQVNEVIDQYAHYEMSSINLQHGMTVNRINVAYVSSDFFSILGINPLLWHVSIDHKKQQNADQGIILSYNLWQTGFASDKNILNQSIRLHDRVLTVIGVMPKEFNVYDNVTRHDAWVSNNPESPVLIADYRSIARLKPSLSIENASAKLNLILQRGRAELLSPEARIKLVTIQEKLSGDLRQPLLLLLVAMACVLLIACLNITSLLLIRSTTKQKEIAICTALGAGRARLLKQWLSESIILIILGGGGGLILTKIIIHTLQSSELLTNIAPFASLTINAKVILFTVALSLVICILQACFLAYKLSQIDIYTVLKEGGIRSSVQLSPGYRAITVISSIAIALALVLSSISLIKSVKKILEGTGYDYHNLLTFELSTSEEDKNQRVSLYKQVLDQTSKLPGVTHAGIINFLPNFSGSFTTSVNLDSRTVTNSSHATLSLRKVSSDYFRAMKIPLIKGRYFTEYDVKGSKPLIILDESAAKKFDKYLSRNESIIGKLLTIPAYNDKTIVKYEVIGIVGNIQANGLNVDSPPGFYLHSLQYPPTFASLVVRTSVNPVIVIPGLRDTIYKIDNNQPVSGVKIHEQLIMGELARKRATVLLLSAFAIMALVLTVIGIFGVVSYTVTQQTHDIGIRIVLGAQPLDTFKFFLTRILIMIILGVISGSIMNQGISKFMASYLYGYSPINTTTQLNIILSLILVALFASYLPIRKAMKIDPLNSIRYE